MIIRDENNKKLRGNIEEWDSVKSESEEACTGRSLDVNQ